MKCQISSINIVKKYLFLIITTCVFTENCSAQPLDMDGTRAFLEETINKDLNTGLARYRGKRKVSLSIIDDKIRVRYIWEGNNNVLYREYINEGINYNEYIFSIASIATLIKKDSDTKKTVAIRCTNKTKSCFYSNVKAIRPAFSKSFFDLDGFDHNDFIYLFYLNDAETQDKVYTALKYLLSNFNDTLKKDLGEGFRIVTYGKDYHEIDLKPKNGVSYADINIGGVLTSAVLDSGASDLSISEEIENQLLQKGIIDRSDYLEDGLYTIANGSTVRSRRFIVPYVKLGDIKVENIRCSVGSKSGSILLGRTVLDRFKRWTLENKKRKLIIEI